MTIGYERVKRARQKKLLRLQKMKDGQLCSRCKKPFPHYQLDYHHTDRETKEFSLSKANRNNIAWDRIYKEIQKCILLCKNCHAEVEWELR